MNLLYQKYNFAVDIFDIYLVLLTLLLICCQALINL